MPNVCPRQHREGSEGGRLCKVLLSLFSVKASLHTLLCTAVCITSLSRQAYYTVYS